MCLRDSCLWEITPLFVCVFAPATLPVGSFLSLSGRVAACQCGEGGGGGGTVCFFFGGGGGGKGGG